MLRNAFIFVLSCMNEIQSISEEIEGKIVSGYTCIIMSVQEHTRRMGADEYMKLIFSHFRKHAVSL